MAHFFWVLGGWTSVRAVFKKNSAFFTLFPNKKGLDFYLDRVFGGPGVDFYSGMEQTRKMDLYEGGEFTNTVKREPCAGHGR